MKIATLEMAGVPVLGVRRGEGWWQSTRGLSVSDVIGGAAIVASEFEPAPADARLVLPFRPGTVIGVGLNFAATVREMNRAVPTEPYLFPKLTGSVTGPDQPIVVDEHLTTRADWEGELAVIIGRRARHVRADHALDFVFGYTAANDVSARDLQERDGQWLRGKGLDGFCPLGPLIVTRDEIPDPQALRIRTRVNGETVQDGSTADMIFGVAQLIEYCSAAFTLYPGDVLLTGTPPGCGDFQNPPRSLHPGDAVEVELDGVGLLRNPIMAP